jgi:hypothetical protein
VENTEPSVPVLEGWVSLPVAAGRLEVKRQRIFQMGTEENKLASLRKVLGSGKRPAVYVVSEAELCRLRREQLEAAIRVAQDTDEGRHEVGILRGLLGAVQLDAVRLLYVQLGAAAEAAAVAGDEDLARLLRKRAAGMQAPVVAA